ncbi:MAG: MBOAT family O-acyltransferase, partial [Arenicellales bacterium]
MVFSSVLFLFLFLPVVLLLYWVIPNKWRNSFLLIVSLTFYAWGEGLFVGIMLLSIAMNYVFGLAIERGNARAGRLWVGIAVMANLALLGVFKYANFLVENINTLFSSTGIQLITIDQIHLPIGISFFTFQAMSYVIEVHRRVMPAQTNLLNLGLYIALFPQLIAGPIVRYHDIAAQLKTRFVNAGQVAYGIERFVIGLGKKVLIANPMGAVADEIFALPPDSITATVAWTAVACYSLQIYFDFSGYSDMAIGLGRMFGFKFLENFNYPYISQSIQEFWRRWHISLSNWFRDFLYLPLGGNRRGPGRTYFNLLIVFLLCGLWHGASWNFVVWGLLHGSFLVLERIGFLGVLN